MNTTTPEPQSQMSTRCMLTFKPISRLLIDTPFRLAVSTPTPTLSSSNDLEKHSQQPSQPDPSRGHDPQAPDLSFPFATTNIASGGLTNEYRTANAEGYVSATRPGVLTRVPSEPAAQFWRNDEEQARRMKDVKLVTWTVGDKEDPRNWSNTYRWCKCIVGVLK